MQGILNVILGIQFVLAGLLGIWFGLASVGSGWILAMSGVMLIGMGAYRFIELRKQSS